MKILVSQPKPASDKSPYYTIADKYNVEIVFRPFIKTEAIGAKEFRSQKINLADYNAVIFTSRTAVDNYFRLAEETRFHIPDTMRYLCTSEPIALYLQKYIVYRKRKIAFGLTGRMQDDQFITALKKYKKDKFLIPISDVHKENLSVLDNAKINYTKAVMYRTVSNDFTEDEPFDYDMLIFFSPQGINSLKKNFPDFDQKARGIKVATFGATTTKAAEEAGLEVDIMAPTPEYPSMTSALEDFLKKNSKKK